MSVTFVSSYLLACSKVYTYEHASLITVSDIPLLITLSSDLPPLFVVTNSVIPVAIKGATPTLQFHSTISLYSLTLQS